MKQEHKDAIEKRAILRYPKPTGLGSRYATDHDELSRIALIHFAEFGYHLRDEEVKELKDYNVELSNKAISLMVEVERLKGLIEEAYYAGWNTYDDNLNGSSCFNDFKQKHGL